MEFKYYIKIKDRYENRILIPPKNSDKNFFTSFLLLLEEQNELLKQDILIYFPNKKTNIAMPKHDDFEIQLKIDKLVELRHINLQTKDIIKALLQENDFIICECGGKMYKTPINVFYKKYGNTYALHNLDDKSIKYLYICENCTHSVDENCYNCLKRNINWREKLLRDGYNWVPNEFGVWHWVGVGDNKPEELIDNEKYTYERYYEYHKIPILNQKTNQIHNSIKCKVFDKCRETGEIIQIL